MTPAALALALQIIQEAIVVEPLLAADLQKLFASGQPTDADFATLIANVGAETYGQFVPASDLPPAETGASAYPSGAV